MGLLSQVRDDYIRFHRPRAKAEAAHFAQGTLAEQVERAALALTPTGKHPHQWRIPPALLKQFSQRLGQKLGELAAAESFADLLAVVEAARLKGVAELTVYDTAARIAVGRGLAPTEVFLHAGTRTGAARLGCNVRRASIPRRDLPTEWAALTPSEIEDLLCSYARYFGAEAEPFAPHRTKGCTTDTKRPLGC